MQKTNRPLNNFIHLTDLHLCPLHKQPQSRSETFHTDIRNKFSYVANYIKKNDIEFVLLSGDIFHTKASSEYSPETLLYYSSLFQSWEVPIYCIAGNHDLQKSSIANINRSAYKLIVSCTPNLTDVSYCIDTFGRSFGAEGFILEHEGIAISGIPYHPLAETQKLLELINEEFAKVSSDLYTICLLHTDAIPEKVPLYWEVMGYDEVFARSSNIDLICQGHIHLQFPIQNNGKTEISKPWSFTRTVKDYYTKTEILEHQHKPSMGVFKEGNAPHYEEIEHIEFSKAFLTDSVKKQMQDSGRLNSFIEEIGKNFEDLGKVFDIESPEQYLEKIEISKEVRDVIDKYVK